ncbi:MAG: right-handed parallel beta-helix repeat-containing protein [Planctomycetota bacterium]
MSSKRNLKMWLAIGLLLSAVVNSAAAETIYYVDAGVAVAADGLTWTNAFNNLQDALAAAGNTDEIWVARGTYRPAPAADSTNPRKATFQLKSGVAVYGGFPSGGGAWQNRDPQSYVTTLSGDLNGDDRADFINNSDNSYHVVTGSGTDATAVLDGFTVTGGNASAVDFHNDRGAGLLNKRGSPTVTNCTFSGNTARWGGGIYNEDSSSMVTNCRFTGNGSQAGSHYNRGAGISNLNSSPTVTNCTFSGNNAYSGAAMYNYRSSPTVTDCILNHNAAARLGGGICNVVDSRPTLANCTFRRNSAYRGGGIYNTGSITLTNCILSRNTATELRGGMCNVADSRSMVTICTFGGGTAGHSSSAIYSTGDITLTNCTL